MQKQTKAIHLDYQRPDAYGALSMPVYHCAAFEFDNAAEMIESFCGRSDMPDYSRVTNPTVTYFERKVQALTGAEDVVAFGSGMAAIANTLFCLASAGRTIVTSRHLFGNTLALVQDTMARFGVGLRFCDLTDTADVEAALDDTTCCIFMEVMTNPQLEVADIAALSSLAHKHRLPLIADTTMVPFIVFDGKALGIDVEVVSSTKYISGGATSIGGLVILHAAESDFKRRMRQEMLMNFGAYMTPHVAYVQTLGLETLAVRYEKQTQNALAMAEALQRMPDVKAVRYPGLQTDAFHDVAVRQFGERPGAMLTLELESREACFRFLDRLQLICRATNLFDNRSLAIHPASTIFGNFTEAQRRDMDISEHLIRLSAGLEDADDLIDDLRQALK
ncbi:MAG: PLP-dependent aspartate aminotransferase family protein [Bacteroidales bacterium]|nr:PLP-dependent aspartate aminotransferase family protein [Bacteroidales bacterium]